MKHYITDTNTLPTEVREVYEMPAELKGGPKFHHPRFGEVDFSRLSVTTASYLVQKGFPYLRLRVETTSDTSAVAIIQKKK